ncbi:MAG: class I SAM-dependent methyltransferase [Tetrasphaera sp.]|nr:class I SAM-dependent methyltransferase [Tetrasphaera sp.]
MSRQQPVGVITRGTTNPNRLRRCDRWLVGPQAWRLRLYAGGAPLVVDLGYGASPVTAVELSDRLLRVRGDVEVLGLEIDPDRVRAARPLARPGLGFAVGGFEIPVPGDRRPVIVRAFNVLRQYPESEVASAWTRTLERLDPQSGLLVDGTCDELGRLSSWVALEPGRGPISLSLSFRLRGLVRPSAVAERLPKALIHRHVPGEGVHALLHELDRQWERAASHTAYGVRQRFLATVEATREAGWPVIDGPARWRLGEVTFAWEAVAPGGRSAVSDSR